MCCQNCVVVMLWCQNRVVMLWCQISAVMLLNSGENSVALLKKKKDQNLD